MVVAGAVLYRLASSEVPGLSSSSTSSRRRPCLRLWGGAAAPPGHVADGDDCVGARLVGAPVEPERCRSSRPSSTTLLTTTSYRC